MARASPRGIHERRPQSWLAGRGATRHGLRGTERPFRRGLRASAALGDSKAEKRGEGASADVRVLFLSPYIPSLVRVRPLHWIRELAHLGHEVHLVALCAPGDEQAPPQDLRRACAAVEVFPLARMRTLANAARAWRDASTPLQLAYSYHPRAERHVARLAASGRFDVVHIEHMRGVALSRRLCNVPIVFDAVDSISALFADTAKLAATRGARLLARLDLERSRRFEARAPFVFSRVVVTSEREAAAFEALAGEAGRRRIAVLPSGVDTAYFRPVGPVEDGAVVFTGKLSYHANEAAALRLVQRIMPLVWARRPHTQVILAGKDPSAALKRLGRDARVTVTGYVDDLRTVFARAAVGVCPLVYGAGIQNKVLEALACGVPAVVASSAAQALAGTPGHHYLACDDDEGFAEAMLDVLNDTELRRRLGKAGRQYVEEHHDWQALARRLAAVHELARAEG